MKGYLKKILSGYNPRVNNLSNKVCHMHVLLSSDMRTINTFTVLAFHCISHVNLIKTLGISRVTILRPDIYPYSMMSKLRYARHGGIALPFPVCISIIKKRFSFVKYYYTIHLALSRGLDIDRVSILLNFSEKQLFLQHSDPLIKFHSLSTIASHLRPVFN